MSSSECHPHTCSGCGEYILDRYFVKVNCSSWHQSCLRCHDCGITLNERCYSRQDVLYCRSDYFRRFGPECHHCKVVIKPDDLVRRVMDLVFHESCLRCSVCGRKTDTGDKIYKGENSTIICEADFTGTGNCAKETGAKSSCSAEKECAQDQTLGHPEMEQKDLEPILKLFSEQEGDLNGTKSALCGEGENPDSSGSTHDGEEDETTKRRLGGDDHGCFHGGNVGNLALSRPGGDLPGRLNHEGIVNCQTSVSKKRGPRTTIKTKQLDMLKAAFIVTPKPTRHIREQLAADTGLPMRVIQVWFQNRRSKERRMKQVSMYGSRRHLHSQFSSGGLAHLSSPFGTPPNVNILHPCPTGMEHMNACGYNNFHDISDSIPNPNQYGIGQIFSDGNALNPGEGVIPDFRMQDLSGGDGAIPDPAEYLENESIARQQMLTGQKDYFVYR